MDATLLTKSSSSSRLESLGKTKQSLRNRLIGIAKKSNFFQLRRMAFGIPYNEQFHTHTTKSGETLTSISKKYGASIYAIAAANMEFKDINFVLEGQKLNIPINVIKSSSYFVVLAPLTAFCIGCMISVFWNSFTGSSKPNGADVGLESSKTRINRWKAVIYGNEFASDAEPLEKACKPSEERAQFVLEMPLAEYAKVESEYLKFLSDCGVSNCGYWRGGTPE